MRAFERDSENETVFVADLNTVNYVQHNGSSAVGCGK